jgi:autotransporter-associated beta strand protein
MKAPTTFLLGKVLVPLVFLSSAYATDLTWAGATGSDWNTSTNWNPNATPTTDDALTILGPGNVAGTLGINVNAASSAGSIAFTNTSATTLNNTSGGSNQTLTLGSALVNGLTTGSGAVTIGSSTSNQGVDVALGANQTWDVGSGDLSVINTVSGAFSIAKNGSGTLGLSGTNTFSGGLVINAGIVNANAAGSLGSGAVTVNSGGRLDLFAEPAGLTGVTFNGGSEVDSRGGARILAGGVTVGGDFTLNGTAAGVNALTLSGAVDLGGATRTITSASSGIVTLSGVISNGGLTKAGSAQLNLDNTANTFAGPLTIQNGTVRIKNDASAGSGIALGDATSISGNLSPTLKINGVATTISKDITVGASNAATTGVYAINSDNGFSAWGLSGATTLNQSLTVTNASGGGLTLSGSFTSGSSGTQTLTLTNNNGTLTVSGAIGGGTGTVAVTLNGNSSMSITGTISGGGALTKSGTTQVFLKSANTFTGDTRVVAGKLDIDANNAGVTGQLQNSTLDMNAADAGTLEFRGSTGTTAATFGGLKGSRNLSLNNTTPAAVALSVGNNNQSTVYSGVLSGSGSITKIGTGTLTLSGTNTYSGGTTVNGGALKVNGSIGDVTINGSGATLAGTGSVSGITLTSGTITPGDGAVGTLTGSSFAWNGGNTLAFDLSSSDSTADLLSLSGALSKTGTGTYAFDFSGGLAGQTYTLINFGSNSGFSSSDFSVNSGMAGTFALNGASLTFTAVPEPHEFALSIVGLLGLMVFIRRRNLQS